MLLDGGRVGRLDRSTSGTKLTLPAHKGSGGGGKRGKGSITLDIVVEAMGRQNFG